MKGVEDYLVVVMYNVRVYLCVCVFLFPVPQQEFNIAFEFNNDSCMLKVECKNDTEAVVDCMLSSNTSGILGNGTVIIPVKSDDRYEFQGTMRSIRVSQSHQVTGTGKVGSDMIS